MGVRCASAPCRDAQVLRSPACSSLLLELLVAAVTALHWPVRHSEQQDAGPRLPGLCLVCRLDIWSPGKCWHVLRTGLATSPP